MATSHRLYVPPERWARLRSLPDHPVLAAAAEQVAADAERYAADRTIPLDVTAHN